jgi:hypothetical protein
VPATRFDGAADKVDCGLGTCDPIGANTLVVVYRRFVATVWHAMIDAEAAGSSTVRTALEITNANLLQVSSQTGSSSGSATTSPGTNVTDYFGHASSHPSGVSAINYYNRNLTANTAITSEAGSGFANALTATRVIFGLWDNTDDANGWLAAAAWFNGALTLAQVTECFANRRTSDIWNCSFGRPAGLWQFNGSSLTDLTGNGANETSRVGATLDAAETPPWTFDGTGVIAPPNRLKRWRY